jgi:hypothetical protein
MFTRMKPSKQSLVWFAAGALMAGVVGDAVADASGNKYEMIVERNPFGLKPPPPPPDPGELNKPPPAPPATVELTGITSILSSKRALFEIVPGPGKPMIKPILAEGERIESIEVVSINVDKNQVTVKNGGVVTNLTFKVAKASGPAGAPAVPGVIPPPVIPGAPPAAPTQSSYNQNQGSGRYNVMVGGGNAAVTPSANPAYNGVNPAYNGTGAGLGATAPALNTGNTANDSGFRSIPSRNMRTAPQAQDPAMSRQQQYEEIEKNRALNYLNSQMTGKAVPPLPPTPITPPDAPGYVHPVLPPLPGQTR